MSLRPYIKTVVVMMMILTVAFTGFAQDTHGDKPADGGALLEGCIVGSRPAPHR